MKTFVALVTSVGGRERIVLVRYNKDVPTLRSHTIGRTADESGWPDGVVRYVLHDPQNLLGDCLSQLVTVTTDKTPAVDERAGDVFHSLTPSAIVLSAQLYDAQ